MPKEEGSKLGPKDEKIKNILFAISNTYREKSGTYKAVQKGLFKLSVQELDALYLMICN